MNISSLNNKKNITILLSGIAVIVLYYILKGAAPALDIYGNIIKTYALWVGSSFEWVAVIFGHNVIYDSVNGQIASSSFTFDIMNKLAVKFYLIAFFIVFIFPRKWKKSIVVFILASVALYALTVLRFFVDLEHREQANYLFLPIIYTGRYLVLYFLIKYKISLHSRLQLYIEKIDHLLHNKFQFRVMTLLFIFVFAIGIMGFIDWYLIVQSPGFIDFLSKWILGYSELMLKILGYQPIVEGYQINIDRNWVYLGTPCLGAGVMTLFVGLVAIIKSEWLNKIVYIIIGINVLILANSIRIIIILLHIYLNQIPADLIEDYHGLSNNFFYLLVFVMLLIYTRWFADIKFIKQKSKKAI